MYMYGNCSILSNVLSEKERNTVFLSTSAIDYQTCDEKRYHSYLMERNRAVCQKASVYNLVDIVAAIH